MSNRKRPNLRDVVQENLEKKIVGAICELERGGYVGNVNAVIVSALVRVLTERLEGLDEPFTYMLAVANHFAKTLLGECSQAGIEDEKLQLSRRGRP
jgi:hypothetical protein